MGKRMDPALSKQEKFQRIVDQTAGSIQRYKTDLTALGAALTYSLGVSSVIGYDMADLGALTGALQSAGLKGTSAGTAVGAFVRGLAQTFRRLKEAGEAANLTMADFIKKAEGGTVASDKMSKMLKDNPLSQISFTDAAGNIRPFAKILQDIEKQFGIVTPEDIVSLEQYSQLLGLLQDEGSRAVLFLLGMGQELEEVTKQIRAGKSATKASDIVNAVFWNRTIMITNRLRVLAKSIGNVLLPSLHDLLDIVTIVTKKLLDFVKLHPDFTKWAVFGSVALGAMLLVAGGITLTTFTIKTAIESFAIILKQISWVTALVSKLGNTLPILYVRLQLLALWTKVAAAATWLWNAALAVNPIILIVAAIIAVVAAIVLLVKHWDWVADKFNMVWTGLREKLAMVPDWILIAFPILLIIKHWDKLWITIRYILDRIGSWLKMFWGKLRKLVGDMPTWFIAIFAPLLLIIKDGDEISNAIGNVSGVVANVATVVWDWLSTTAGKVANVFVSVWNTIKESAITVWNTISNAIVTVLDAIVNSIPFKAISKVFDWVVSGGRSALQFLGFGESFTGIPNQLPGPPALAGAGLAQPTPMLPSHTATTDYSIHRSQINIYPLPSHSPADIAEEINKELKPEGNF
jgi:TP901 family phage tail tape measure protein